MEKFFSSKMKRDRYNNAIAANAMIQSKRLKFKEFCSSQNSVYSLSNLLISSLFCSKQKIYNYFLDNETNSLEGNKISFQSFRFNLAGSICFGLEEISKVIWLWRTIITITEWIHHHSLSSPRQDNLSAIIIIIINDKWM